MSARGFRIASRLAASSDTLWSHASSMAGVNRELFPLLRMTHPAGVSSIDASQLPIGRRAFRSWILLLGIVPVEFDDLTIVELTPGRGFLERSAMLTQREWEHERHIEPTIDGCTLSDRVRFVPRVPALGAVFLVVFRLVFRWRHRNLRRMFGGTAAPNDLRPA
jgi:ligand-binding SRPBCC domain-containing protein